MMEYTLDVTTGNVPHAGTFDHLYVTLIGTEGQSEPTPLLPSGLEDETGKLEKDPFHEFPEEDWFCSNILVKTPEKDEIVFPCYKWLSKGETVVLRGGRATKAFEDNHPRLEDQRKKELVLQKWLFKWETIAGGLPHILNIHNPKALPAEVRFSFTKASQMKHTMRAAEAELKGLSNSTQPWESFEAMKGLYWFKKSIFSDIVSQRWKDDDFFGYQFLNGANPFVIRRCSKLPSNLPVTEEMVKPFLAGGSSLATEMLKGNIFIADYKILDGLPVRVVDGKPLPLAAAICLLYRNPDKKLLPIAIQLGQRPSDNNPIFLPSDSESDWLLAKLYVRHADVTHHQIMVHYLQTHLLAEVFTIATLRNLPMIHPLHKLLIPHHKDTLHINLIGRSTAFGPGRSLENFSLDAVGQMQLMKKALSQTTYSSLCVPENIAVRGLESIPNFYYRDDSLRLWGIINSFVTAIVAYYYPSDSEVMADSELHDWINEIFYYGFLGNVDSGFPSRFHTVEELIKFVTMVIFSSSARHAVLHAGQSDFQAWIPNSPWLLNHAPPAAKGQSTMDDILLALPNKSLGALGVSISWVITRKDDDFVPLGSYPEQRFHEPAVLQMIKNFQAELLSLSDAISMRSTELELPYNYLNPKEIENSVGI